MKRFGQVPRADAFNRPGRPCSQGEVWVCAPGKCVQESDRLEGVPPNFIQIFFESAVNGKIHVNDFAYSLSDFMFLQFPLYGGKFDEREFVVR